MPARWTLAFKISECPSRDSAALTLIHPSVHYKCSRTVVGIASSTSGDFMTMIGKIWYSKFSSLLPAGLAMNQKGIRSW